jgi:hypothetical protein
MTTRVIVLNEGPGNVVVSIMHFRDRTISHSETLTPKTFSNGNGVPFYVYPGQTLEVAESEGDGNNS